MISATADLVISSLASAETNGQGFLFHGYHDRHNATGGYDSVARPHGLQEGGMVFSLLLLRAKEGKIEYHEQQAERVPCLPKPAGPVDPVAPPALTPRRRMN